MILIVATVRLILSPFFSKTQHQHTTEEEDDRDNESRENLRSAVAEFENAKNVDGTFKVMEFVKQGIMDFNSGDFQSAKANFKDAIRENPTCPAGVRVALGHTFFEIGLRAGVHNAKHGEALIAKAEKCFIRALNLDPENVEAKAALGVLEDRKGNVRYYVTRSYNNEDSQNTHKNRYEMH